MKYQARMIIIINVINSFFYIDCIDFIQVF